MRAFRFLIPALFFCTAPAAAEVTQASASGFATRDRVTVSAPAEDVWAALIEPARWWNGSHSWSGDAANLSLEPRAGGCFCERLPPGGAMAEGSVQHMTVVHAAPGRLLRLTGALGPLQSEALTGTLSISLEAAEGGTAMPASRSSRLRLVWTA
jgi:uncharacterized protein YndB with AHSA1/START domain